MNAELKQTQVTIELKLPSSYIEDDHEERSVKVLDFEFFDDLEIVLLAQFDSGFSESSGSLFRSS
jgi:hypothetical protein